METFKVIKGFEEKYKITDKGRVWSNYKQDFLKQGTNTKGYPIVYLSINHTKQKTIAVHRLVAEHFIENPENKKTVNHIDGNKKNNNIENLEWMTHRENTHHAVLTNLYDPKKCGMCREIKLLNTKTNETETYFSITNFAETHNYPPYSVRTCFSKRNKYKHYHLV